MKLGIPEAYKAAILAAHEDHTRVTRAFSGRPARGIVNRFMSEMDARQDVVLPFPLQNSLTRPLRAAAAKQGKAEFLSLWAGQGRPPGPTSVGPGADCALGHGDRGDPGRAGTSFASPISHKSK